MVVPDCAPCAPTPLRTPASNTRRKMLTGIGALAALLCLAAAVHATPSFEQPRLTPNGILVPDETIALIEVDWTWSCDAAAQTGIEGTTTTAQFVSELLTTAPGLLINGETSHSVDLTPCLFDPTGTLGDTWSWQLQATSEAPGIEPLAIQTIIYDSPDGTTQGTSIASGNLEVQVQYIGELQVAWEPLPPSGMAPLTVNATVTNMGNAPTKVIVSSLTPGVAIEPAFFMIDPDPNGTVRQFDFIAGPEVDGPITIDIEMIPAAAQDDTIEGTPVTSQLSLTFESPVQEKDSPAPLAAPVLAWAAWRARRRS